MNIIRIIAAWILCFAFAASAPADDWPQWRGPDRDGISKETGLMKAWPEGGPALDWKIGGLGEGYGSVAVVGDRIFVQGTNDRDSLVFCLNRADGKKLWTVPLGERLVQDKGNGPRGTPTVVDGVLYALTGMGELACLNQADGTERWRINILEEFNASNIGWGISESPLVDGGHLIVSPGGRNAGIVALDRNTGKTLWRCTGLDGPAAYSSAIVANVGDVRVIMNFTKDAGVGVRANDGKLLWEYKAPANGTANCTTPIFHDNKVFYTSNYGVGGGLLALTPQGNEVETQELYFNKDMKNHHGGIVLLDGHIYGFNDHILTCMDFETGEVKWQDRSVGKGVTIAADGMLYLLGERYTVGLAEATPEGYRERGRFQIEDRGQPSWAYPAVSGGKLYIRNQDQLSCYDISLPADSGGGQ